MPWPLPESPDARLALAKGYPYETPPHSYLLRDGELLPIGEAGFEGRVAVIGHGSNRAPAQLTRKFGQTREGAPLSGWSLPVTFGWLHDYDVVYSAHVTGYGAIASTLTHCPGVRTRVAVNWLDEAQLVRMHETEGRNYPFGCLRAIEIELEAGPAAVLVDPHVYHSRHGALLHERQPIGLAASPAERRPHHTMAQEDVQELIRARHHPDHDLDSHILANIADPMRREALIAAMRDHARPAEAPHFEEVDPLEEWA